MSSIADRPLYSGIFGVDFSGFNGSDRNLCGNADNVLIGFGLISLLFVGVSVEGVDMSNIQD
jgi:hypothetical protein